MRKFLIILLFFVVAFFCLGLVGKKTFDAKEKKETKKEWVITYRIDEGNKRGTPQKTVVTADSSASAKENFRTSNPKATIISCTQKSTAALAVNP